MRHALAFASSMLVLAACGGDSTSLDEAGDKLHSEYCQYLAHCGLVESEAKCADMNIGVTFTNDPSLQAAIDAGKIHYDGDKVTECYDGLGSRSCDSTSESGRGFGSSTACQDAVKGTVGDGGQCALDDECKSLDCNVPTCPDACCQGTCVGDAPPTIAHRGEPCEGLTSCESGTYCNTTGTGAGTGAGTCTDLLAADAPCTSTSQCAYGLGCAGASGMRTCRALPKLGEACPDGACRDAGTHCSTDQMICVKVGLEGATCATRADCSSFYTCDMTTLKCVAGAHEGESCATLRCADDGDFCDPTTTTCKPPQPDGSACTQSSNCASSYCAVTNPQMPTMRTCATRDVCI